MKPLEFICILAGILFLMKTLLFLYLAIMLYKDNYSKYKTKDDCSKAPTFLNLICPFWNKDESECMNGIVTDEENNCSLPENNSIVIYISCGIISAIVSVIFFYYGFKRNDNSISKPYSYDEYKKGDSISKLYNYDEYKKGDSISKLYNYDEYRKGDSISKPYNYDEYRKGDSISKPYNYDNSYYN
jgi:hypothetical protein